MTQQQQHRSSGSNGGVVDGDEALMIMTMMSEQKT